MDNDKWANKIFKNVAVLIMSYPGQRAFLRACIETHERLGYFMALAYDNYVDYNDFMPDKEILDKVDLFFMAHKQSWGDTDYPFFWGLKWGASLLRQFDYVYCVNGDFILENPEGFNKVLSLLGNNDIMTCGPDIENDITEIATGAFVVRSKALIDIMDYVQDCYIPFDNYEKNVYALPNIETRMYVAINNLGLKKLSVSKPLIWDEAVFSPGTWHEMVGMRHIHGEVDYAIKTKGIPPHYKYLEEKYLLPVYDYKRIKEYWDTEDEGVLKKWWLK
jgi:hypothetical protein